MEIWKPRRKPSLLDRSRWSRTSKNHQYIRMGNAVFKVTTITGNAELSDKELKDAFCIVACIKEKNPSEQVCNTLKKIHANGKLIYGIIHKDVDMTKYPDIRWKKTFIFDKDYEVPNLMKQIHEEIRRDHKLWSVGTVGLKDIMSVKPNPNHHVIVKFVKVKHMRNNKLWNVSCVFLIDTKTVF